jgi:hypothetical protein
MSQNTQCMSNGEKIWQKSQAKNLPKLFWARNPRNSIRPWYIAVLKSAWYLKYVSQNLNRLVLAFSGYVILYYIQLSMFSLRWRVERNHSNIPFPPKLSGGHKEMSSIWADQWRPRI